MRADTAVARQQAARGFARLPRPPALRSARRTAAPVRAYVESDKAVPAPPTPKAANQLEALKQMSKVVADTGEIEAMKLYKPVDCTTNPSLVLKAMANPEYAQYLEQAIAAERRAGALRSDGARPFAGVADRLAVTIGAEVLKLVPGRVSTEVDAHLSYDSRATVDKALRLVELYAAAGVEPRRLYIKAASTWEGIRACEQLQKQGIDCNMTLLFSFAQAAACADAGAALISPFVGRILDWHKKHQGRDFAAHEDPGVLSVRRIYMYYKHHGFKTIVMAASFRNKGEICELAGCDNITIRPALLKELESSTEPLPYKLWPGMGGCEEERLHFGPGDKAAWDALHSSDQMAVDKLREGIEGFSKDQATLERMIGEAVEKIHL